MGIKQNLNMFGYKTAGLSLAVVGASMYYSQGEDKSAFLADLERNLQWDDLDAAFNDLENWANDVNDWATTTDWDYTTYTDYTDYSTYDYSTYYDNTYYGDVYYGDWEDFEDAAGTAIAVIIFVWIMIPICCLCGIGWGIWGCCTGCGGR